MIIDTGAGIGEHIQMFLKAADDVIVVTVPDPAAITDAYATIKTIAIMRNDISMIMNQVRGEGEALAVFNKIKKVAHSNIREDLNLSLLGKVNSDSRVSMAVKQRELVSVVSQGSQPVIDLELIAAEIAKNLERNVLVSSTESGLAGLFRRLMQHF
jgi:flagellar biosynthesis protein FlhG